MKSLAALILTLVLPARVFGSTSPWTTFENLRQGIKPTLEFEGGFARVKKDLISRNLTFDRMLSSQAKSKGEYCAKFVKVTRHMLNSLNATMDHFKDPSLPAGDTESQLAYVRLLITIPYFESLHQLFTHGRDGGYGTIDRRPVETCEYRDRVVVEQSFAELVQAYATFRIAALGSPGLIPLEQLTDQLLVLADAQQSRFDTMTWVILGGTIVADILLWQLAPMWIAGKGLVKVGKFALLGLGESAGLIGLDYFANPEVEARTRPKIPSWGEIMRDIDDLAESSFNQPQLYLAYLTVVQARLSAMVGAWVQTNQAELNKMVPQ